VHDDWQCHVTKVILTHAKPNLPWQWIHTHRFCPPHASLSPQHFSAAFKKNKISILQIYRFKIIFSSAQNFTSFIIKITLINSFFFFFISLCVILLLPRFSNSTFFYGTGIKIKILNDFFLTIFLKIFINPFSIFIFHCQYFITH